MEKIILPKWYSSLPYSQKVHSVERHNVAQRQTHQTLTS